MGFGWLETVLISFTAEMPKNCWSDVIVVVVEVSVDDRAWTIAEGSVPECVMTNIMEVLYRYRKRMIYIEETEAGNRNA